MSKVFALSNQDCYELFGCEKNLEGLEFINSMIINGLYDDADIALRNGKVVYGYDAVDCLDEEQLLEIIAVKRKASDYYANTREAKGYEVFNNPCSEENRQYRKLSKEFKVLAKLI
jgi:hypothetical protein